jgi:hypothetical protein
MNGSASSGAFLAGVVRDRAPTTSPRSGASFSSRRSSTCRPLRGRQFAAVDAVVIGAHPLAAQPTRPLSSAAAGPGARLRWRIRSSFSSRWRQWLLRKRRRSRSRRPGWRWYCSVLTETPVRAASCRHERPSTSPSARAVSSQGEGRGSPPRHRKSPTSDFASLVRPEPSRRVSGEALACGAEATARRRVAPLLFLVRCTSRGLYFHSDPAERKCSETFAQPAQATASRESEPIVGGRLQDRSIAEQQPGSHRSAPPPCTAMPMSVTRLTCECCRTLAGPDAPSPGMGG